jgi:hypothetical protein
MPSFDPNITGRRVGFDLQDAGANGLENKSKGMVSPPPPGTSLAEDKFEGANNKAFVKPLGALTPKPAYRGEVTGLPTRGESRAEAVRLFSFGQEITKLETANIPADLAKKVTENVGKGTTLPVLDDRQGSWLEHKKTFIKGLIAKSPKERWKSEDEIRVHISKVSEGNLETLQKLCTMSHQELTQARVAVCGLAKKEENKSGFWGRLLGFKAAKAEKALSDMTDLIDMALGYNKTNAKKEVKWAADDKPQVEPGEYGPRTMLIPKRKVSSAHGSSNEVSSTVEWPIDERLQLKPSKEVMAALTEEEKGKYQAIRQEIDGYIEGIKKRPEESKKMNRQLGESLDKRDRLLAAVQERLDQAE